MDDKFDTLRDDFLNFKSEVRETNAGLKQWQAETTEYRKTLCTKIDIITNKLNELPCRERGGYYKSLTNQIRVIWGIVTLFIGALIVEWFRKR